MSASVNPIEIAYAAMKSPTEREAWDTFVSQLESLGLQHCVFTNNIVHELVSELRYPSADDTFVTEEATPIFDNLLSVTDGVCFELLSQVIKSNQEQLVIPEEEMKKDIYKSKTVVFEYLLDNQIEGIWYVPIVNGYERTHSIMSIAHLSAPKIRSVLKYQRSLLQRSVIQLNESLKVRRIADDYRPKAVLTPREKDCLAWYNVGRSACEIGAMLNVSEHTVNGYFRSSRTKLKASTTSQAAARAMLLELYRP